jgi:hypothetical protein
MQALKHIGIDTDTWDVLITHVITNKFDINTRKEWEKYQISGDLPTLNELLQFIAEKCVVLETLEKHKFEIRSNGSSETRQVPNLNRTNNNRLIIIKFIKAIQWSRLPLIFKKIARFVNKII